MEQNFIFAFAQESSNISVGYIERIRPGYERMPKVYNSFEKILWLLQYWHVLTGKILCSIMPTISTYLTTIFTSDKMVY